MKPASVSIFDTCWDVFAQYSKPDEGVQQINSRLRFLPWPHGMEEEELANAVRDLRHSYRYRNEADFIKLLNAITFKRTDVLWSPYTIAVARIQSPALLT